MLGRDNEHLVASTPAFHGGHIVDQFCGQCAPDLPVMEVSEIDQPLFRALLIRWKRYYLGKRRRREDRALFRSLNMALHASRLPSGADTVFYDLGRLVALWVSAFEILAHPGHKGKTGPGPVYDLLEQVSYLNPKVGRRSFVVQRGSNRRNLPCRVYKRLYVARNDFLHGNQLRRKVLDPKEGLFWLAPSLFRMALTSYLDLSFNLRRFGRLDPRHSFNPPLADVTHQQMEFDRYQDLVERALLRSRR
jgi:hypothetical protein